MSDMRNTKNINRTSNTISISTFWENHLLNKYDFEPQYQRKSIWSDEKQSYLIDSIMKNFPMPPIFLRQIIDIGTGKSKYEVIDGKQRLTSIIRFIQNEIPIASEAPVEALDDERILGLYFNGLDDDKLLEYKRSFWSYQIPVEYIDINSNLVIDNIFDRLNRNGEPLNGQELRNAKYHDSELLRSIVNLTDHVFWAERLKGLDKNRMEDIEFTSELIFMMLEGTPLHANPDILDQYYEKYMLTSRDDIPNIITEFNIITQFMQNLELEYSELRITGVSHLYGLWCLSYHCVHLHLPIEVVRPKIQSFYTDLRSGNHNDNQYLINYKVSMSARTRDVSARRKRMNALIGYLG